MTKKFLKIFSVILLIIFLAALATAITASILYINGKIKEYRTIKKDLSELICLKEKEERIETIEKTLMIQYKLCWYEAHYYSIIIDDFSQKDSVPWQAYAAMVRIESNFDPTVVSEKGAKGMTQVLEPTAKGVAADLGIPFVEKRTLWNDIINMVIGFQYLGQNIRKMGLEDGFRAYLGGPGFDRGRKDINDYRTTIRWEFERLQYIHAGILNNSYKFHPLDSADGNR